MSALVPRTKVLGLYRQMLKASHGYVLNHFFTKSILNFFFFFLLLHFFVSFCPPTLIIIPIDYILTIITFTYPHFV